MLPPVATPQTGIFALGTMSHAYLELDERPGVDPRDLVQHVAGIHLSEDVTAGWIEDRFGGRPVPTNCG